MDFTAQYCPTRKDLEERSWGLVSRLASLSGQLLKLTGAGHQEFMAVKFQCVEVRGEISKAKGQLLDHRSAHGC